MLCESIDLLSKNQKFCPKGGLKFVCSCPELPDPRTDDGS